MDTGTSCSHEAGGTLTRTMFVASDDVCFV